MQSRRFRASRHRGLTLIELVVVLTVLTALGGLLVPVIGNMIARTHFAKCAVTIPEATRQIVRSYAMNMRYPDRWDSLIDETDGTSLFGKLPGEGDARGTLKTITLNQDQVDGLFALGIGTVIDLDATLPNDATWDVATTPRALADGGTLAALDLASDSIQSLNLKRHLLADGSVDPASTIEYIVFGIGNSCTAVGPNGLFVEAPTHFGGEDVMNPTQVYQRYVAIFSIDADGNVNFETAASVHPDGLDGSEAHIRSFYDDTV